MIIFVAIVVLISCSAIGLNWLRHIDLGLWFDSPYMLTGDIARTSTEAFVNLSLSEGCDFYHYYSVSPGETHDLMRFTVPPTVLKAILADTTALCFGTTLQPQPDESAVSFMTPVKSYQPLGTPESTPQPIPDYTWLTPAPDHHYMGANCQTKKDKHTTYYKIRVDDTDSQMWTVWLEVYSG